MNKKIIKPIVLGIIFILAMAAFSVTTNKVNIDLTANMEEATLPVMYFMYDERPLNELHGYTAKMDMMSMRDDILPVGEEKLFSLRLRSFGQSIENLSYQIRSLDGERLLMEEKNVALVSEDGEWTYSVTLPSLLEEGVEYNMELTATVEGKEVYYYTRLMRSTQNYVDECLAFAEKFHDYTFRDDAAEFIPNYMDPAKGDPTKLSYVDLSCTLRQITWAKFEGVKFTEPIMAVKEINNSYNVLVMRYVMTNVNENNETEYYNVEEYYRLRQTPTRMYVLNFERRMNQIFRGENDFFNGNTGLLLGIRDGEVEYKANDAGNCIAFVQEGDLWCYNRATNSMVQVYSFRGPEGIDIRENWDQHDIEIVRVDEAGSIDFIVYGYMNRGTHEGEVGVGVYHFDGIAHTIEEESFIASDKSFEKLKAELGECMYVNEAKTLYLMMNEDIYSIDLNTKSVQLIVDIQNGQGYAVSDSRRYIAWVDADKLYNSSVIHLMDLKTGIRHEIKSGSDTYLTPLEFIGEDFIYGVANIADVKQDSIGNWIYPMAAIEILNTAEEKLELIKRYTPRSGHVGGVTVEDKNIRVELLQETDGRYEAVGYDTIMNRETTVANEVYIRTSVTDVKQTQIVLNMKETTEIKNVKLISSTHILLDEDEELQLDFAKAEPFYYVYLKGDVLMATANVSEAITCANDNYGVVVDKNLHYIYKRARNTTHAAISNLAVNEADKEANAMVKCVSAILEREEMGLSVNELIAAGQTPYHILRSSLKHATVLELSGCKADELLYYVDLGNPVLAKTGENEAILITGYSASKIYYYNPNNGKTESVEEEDLNELFYNGGNYFIVYLK